MWLLVPCAMVTIMLDCRYTEGLKQFFNRVLELGDFIRSKLEGGDEVRDVEGMSEVGVGGRDEVRGGVGGKG